MSTKYASIDIGTNTLRLLIAEIGNENLQPVYLKRIITRLGGDYKEDIGIAASAQERTIKALEFFAEKIREYVVKEVKAVATSVVRRAKNKTEFLSEVLERTGVEVKVISGDEEARLSLLGVVHLTEKYLKADPPARNELDAMESEINGVIADLKDLMKKDGCLPSAFTLQPSALLIGTAGTITTLAAIDHGLEKYEPDKKIGRA